MEIDPRQRRELGPLDDVDGTPYARAEVREAFERGRRDDERQRLVAPGFDEPPDDEPAFGDEEAVRPQPHGIADVRVLRENSPAGITRRFEPPTGGSGADR